MRVMLTQRNQITIPKNLISELNLELGKYYELDIKNDQIILDISHVYDEIEGTEVQPIKTIPPSIKSTIKIESNLEEGKNFSRKVYSDCGLVIRTKRSYLNKFCEACQGQLAEQYGIENHPCKYCVPDNVKPDNVKPDNVKPDNSNVIENIQKNINTLNTKIDQDIEILSSKEYL